MLTGIEPTYIIAGVGFLGLALALATAKRARHKAEAAFADREQEFLARIDARLAEFSSQSARSTSDAMERIHSDIQSLQTDMEWLAGERMIEQAIEMARIGHSASEISTDLGMPLEAANTITKYRRH